MTHTLETSDEIKSVESDQNSTSYNPIYSWAVVDLDADKSAAR